MLWVPLIVGLAIVVTTLLSKIRGDHPEWGVLLSTTFIVVIFLGLMPKIAEAISVFSALASEVNVGSMYLAPVMKTIAIAYITSFGSQVSRDAGEEAIASIVELAGKVVIVIVALPVVQAILYSLLGILEQ